MKTPRVINTISALQRRGVNLEDYDELDQEFFIAYEQHLLSREFAVTKAELAVSCSAEQYSKLIEILLPFYQPDAADRQAKELARISAKAKEYMNKDYVVTGSSGNVRITIKDVLV